MPSLSIIVVITEIGTKATVVSHDIAAALIGAALLPVLFPTIAAALLPARGKAAPVARD